MFGMLERVSPPAVRTGDSLDETAFKSALSITPVHTKRLLPLRLVANFGCCYEWPPWHSLNNNLIFILITFLGNLKTNK
jgi:hypothetical protein